MWVKTKDLVFDISRIYMFWSHYPDSNYLQQDMDDNVADILTITRAHNESGPLSFSPCSIMGTLNG